MPEAATRHAPVRESAVAGRSREFLTFRIGREEYGIEILKVQEIRGFESPTRIVGAPESVLGIRDLRGVIVPIIDLRLRLGVTQPQYDTQTVTIVLNLKQGVIGVVVDSVSDVVDIRETDIRPTPELSGPIESNRIIGIATIHSGDGSRMLILLDIEMLVCNDDHSLASSSHQDI